MYTWLFTCHRHCLLSINIINMVVKHNLHIASWNVNGFKCKGNNKFKDPDFLREISNKDVFCLMETHCALEDCLSISGFKSVHLVRPKIKNTNKRAGGLSIFVKDELKPGIKFLEHANNDYIWLSLSKTFFSLNEDMFICFIYNPPSCTNYSQSLQEDIFSLIEKDITFYSKKGTIILAGDLNARCCSLEQDFIVNEAFNEDIPLFEGYTPDIDIPTRFSQDMTTTARGKDLNDICIQSGLRILNGRTLGDLTGQFTCHTPRGSSIVDYMIVSEQLLSKVKFFKVHEFRGDLSDHCQISVMLNIDYLILTEEASIHDAPVKYIWDESSILSFQSAIMIPSTQEDIKKLENNKSTSDIDKIAEDLNNILLNVANNSLKRKVAEKNKVKNKNKPKPKWFDISLNKLKRQLYEKERLFQKFKKDPIVRGSYFSHLKLYRKTRKFKYREYRSQLINELDELKDNDPQKYWSLLKKLGGNENNKNDTEISSKEWLDYFKNLGQPPDLSNPDLETELNNLEKEVIFNELDYKITEKEISDAIRSLKNNKASSFDSVLNEMLKYGQSYLLKSFYKIFNLVLTNGEFPKLWSRGFIVPLFKNGSREDPGNYRGITIGSNIGKLFTKILNSRLEKFFNSRNLICKEQIGFCKKKRTSDHMFVLKTLIDKYTQTGSKHLYTCFIDFKKAFDTVWHTGLFYKMKKCGISNKFYNIIKNMYLHTETCVKINNDKVTDSFHPSVGVRQGDNLSPNLFKLFINDLPDIFSPACCPVTLNSTKIHCLLYADDVILLSESQTGLQNCLDKLSEYCDTWGLEINTNKSKALIFNKSGRLKTNRFIYKQKTIENVRNYTYLGLKFGVSGKFTDAKKDLYKKGLKAYFKMINSFNDKKPKLKTLIHVFDHTVKPVLLYASEIWGCFQSNKLNEPNNCYFSKLCSDLQQENVHKKLCKYLLEVNKRATTIGVMGELGRFPIMIEVILNMLSYYARLYFSDNELLTQAFFASEQLSKDKKSSWFSCIKVIIDFMGIPEGKLFINEKINKRLVLKTLHEKYKKSWHEQLFRDYPNQDHGNKLRTFRTFKTYFHFEKYLEWGDYKKRKTITKFRISNHDLEIEKGRYIGLQANQRLCKLCSSEMEDEIHFLLKCNKLDHIRKQFLDIMKIKYKNFQALNIKDKFVWLLSSEDHFILDQLYSLITKLNEEKNNLLEVSSN